MDTNKIIATIREALRNHKRIVIVYPPDYDGCLDIFAAEVKGLSEKNSSVVFAFEHGSKEGQSNWDVLVEAARAIIAQDERKK